MAGAQAINAMTDEQAWREIERAIGGLQASVDTLTRQWAAQDAKASAGRGELHGKLDALRLDMVVVQSDVQNIGTAVGKLTPTVQTLEAQRIEREGARKMLGMIYGGIGAAAGIAGAFLVELAKALFVGGPRP